MPISIYYLSSLRQIKDTGYLFQNLSSFDFKTTDVKMPSP